MRLKLCSLAVFVCCACSAVSVSAQETLQIPTLEAPKTNVQTATVTPPSDSGGASRVIRIDDPAPEQPGFKLPDKLANPKRPAELAIPDVQPKEEPPRAPELSMPNNVSSLSNVKVQDTGGPANIGQVAARSEADIREEAFNAALRGILPLQPEEIRRLLERFDATRQAVEIPVHPYPKPEVVVRTVPMDPGAKPLTIKVGVGHVATLSILDVTGAPWPILDMTWAGNFEVVLPEAGGHVMRITPTSDFAYGNISLRLQRLDTPVIFTLQTARDSIHYRFDARIPEFGPYSNLPLVEGTKNLAAGSEALAMFLGGTPPLESERLSVSGVDGRTTAYRLGRKTYLRTPMTLLSPGWNSSVSSGDGMSVYELDDTPVVLLSDRGEVLRAHLTREGIIQ